MKILKSLSKYFFFVLLSSLFVSSVCAEDEPTDIWNIDKKKEDQVLITDPINSDKKKGTKKDLEVSIYEMQSKKASDIIKLDQNLSKNETLIFGLYDPEDYSLDINMWSFSDGDQLKNIFSKIEKIELSSDAKEIMNISMLINAHPPNKNITYKEFFNIRSNWLIKNSDLELIENYLIKNQIFNFNSNLSRYLVDEYLSSADFKKACEIFSKNTKPLEDIYLIKFNIYCLLKANRNEEAKLIFDLKKEMGLNDKYFEKKINYLFQYTSKIDSEISEKSILDFHLAHQTNPNFIFEPNESTKKIIWKYLSSANLLNSFKEIDITELDRISVLEKAVHNRNFPEKDLLNVYKRFQFNINELLNAKDFYKSLSSIEARALIYQKVLLESEINEKLKLLKILKDLFKKDNLENAFNVELKKFLALVDPMTIPDNLTSFYYTNIEIKKNLEKKIKFNNDILHQSKLINYFNGDYSKAKIEKDINNFLKKIKRNKKYLLSKKDHIFLESLKSDGIKIDKKYEDLIKNDASEIPTDIQVMINNNEKGAALLRIIELIGQDKLERIDDDTIYFIISALNQLDIDIIRNKILLKVLPLKV
ncbi:MAG: hypothetical protein CBE46_002100 [Candidatus Pelagibacter sp. TMED286]|nr:MAG: hypothetical protein CBE46_002100 [Candidatus Pelagibacter sp. TMED286]